jgi:hypothetical protein
VVLPTGIVRRSRGSLAYEFDRRRHGQLHIVTTHLVIVVLVFILEGRKLGLKRVLLLGHGVEFFVKLLTDLKPQRLAGAGLPTKILNSRRLEPCCQEELN